MPGHYIISKRGDGWAIAVDGSMLLICERKKVAIQAVRDAMRNAAPVDASDPTCGTAPQAETDGDVENPIAMAS